MTASYSQMAELVLNSDKHNKTMLETFDPYSEKTFADFRAAIATICAQIFYPARPEELYNTTTVGSRIVSGLTFPGCQNNYSQNTRIYVIPNDFFKNLKIDIKDMRFGINSVLFFDTFKCIKYNFKTANKEGVDNEKLFKEYNDLFVSILQKITGASFIEKVALETFVLIEILRHMQKTVEAPKAIYVLPDEVYLKTTSFMEFLSMRDIEA